MQFAFTGAAALIAGTLLMPAAAHAQYCAHYSQGTSDCGIPTLQMCQQSVSGVGGYCVPDQSSQIPPNLIQRRRQQRGQSGQPYLHPQQPREDMPGGLNWMPPPPGQ